MGQTIMVAAGMPDRREKEYQNGLKVGYIFPQHAPAIYFPHPHPLTVHWSFEFIFGFTDEGQARSKALPLNQGSKQEPLLGEGTSYPSHNTHPQIHRLRF